LGSNSAKKTASLPCFSLSLSLSLSTVLASKQHYHQLHHRLLPPTTILPPLFPPLSLLQTYFIFLPSLSPQP
jgi:hypothetical protein